MRIRLSDNLHSSDPDTTGDIVQLASPPPQDRTEKIVTPDLSDKNRLFQTHEKSAGSSRKYLLVLGVVALIVAAAAGLFSYLTLPKFGDAIRAPSGLESAVRNHFLEKEKRTSTDIIFYYCESYYWARVGVEKRPDITTNPIYALDTYKARAFAAGDNVWTITAAPITTWEMDAPCN